MLRSLLHTIVRHPPVFDRVRSLIEAGHRGEREVIRRELRPTAGWFDSTHHASVLDVPCGTGIFSPLFPCETYTGVDIDERFVSHARRKFPDRRFLVMDALKLAFEDKSFDNVLMVGFLHHLDDGEVRDVLAEIRRVLKAGGRFLLIEDCPTRSRWNVPGRFLQALDAGEHIRPAEHYRRALRNLFTVEKCEPLRAGLWDYTVFLLRA